MRNNSANAQRKPQPTTIEEILAWQSQYSRFTKEQNGEVATGSDPFDWVEEDIAWALKGLDDTYPDEPESAWTEEDLALYPDQLEPVWTETSAAQWAKGIRIAEALGVNFSDPECNWWFLSKESTVEEAGVLAKRAKELGVPVEKLVNWSDSYFRPRYDNLSDMEFEDSSPLPRTWPSSSKREFRKDLRNSRAQSGRRTNRTGTKYWRNTKYV